MLRYTPFAAPPLTLGHLSIYARRPQKSALPCMQIYTYGAISQKKRRRAVNKFFVKNLPQIIDTRR